MAEANEWDWVPKESLSPSQQATLKSILSRCLHRRLASNVDDENTHLLADMIYRDEQGTLYMEGAATLRQPLSELNADLIEGVQSMSITKQQGMFPLRASGQLIRSDSAYMSTARRQSECSVSKMPSSLLTRAAFVVKPVKSPELKRRPHFY